MDSDIERRKSSEDIAEINKAVKDIHEMNISFNDRFRDHLNSEEIGMVKNNNRLEKIESSLEHVVEGITQFHESLKETNKRIDTNENLLVKYKWVGVGIIIIASLLFTLTKSGFVEFKNPTAHAEVSKIK